MHDSYQAQPKAVITELDYVMVIQYLLFLNLTCKHLGMITNSYSIKSWGGYIVQLEIFSKYTKT